MTNKKTEIDWTPEHVQGFWNWLAANPHVQESYFSNKFGKGIVSLLQATEKLKGQVLDYGCGPGYLLQHILDTGIECYGVDSSETSMRSVNAAYSKYPNWKGGLVIDGITTPISDNFFDVITCIETIEHLSQEIFQKLLKELRRLMKPGGIILFTTPFNENLEERMIYCPFCDSEFHRVQHVQTFTIARLRSILSDAGFQIVFCQNLDFKFFQQNSTVCSIKSVGPRNLRATLNYGRRQALDKLFPAPFPNQRDTQFRLNLGAKGTHLCAVVTKER